MVIQEFSDDQQSMLALTESGLIYLIVCQNKLSLQYLLQLFMKILNDNLFSRIYINQISLCHRMYYFSYTCNDRAIRNRSTGLFRKLIEPIIWINMNYSYFLDLPWDAKWVEVSRTTIRHSIAYSIEAYFKFQTQYFI